jgi:hypothetical protein
VLIELTAPREWKERAHGAPRVGGTRKEQHVRACSDRLPRPPLDRSIVNEREGVRDCNPLEPEAAEQPVRLRLKRCAKARAVKRLTDHDTSQSCGDRASIRDEVLWSDVRVDMRTRVGRVRSGAKAREMLCARSIAEPARKRLSETRRAELTRAERTIGRIEDRCKVYIDMRPTKSDTRCTAGRASLARAAISTRSYERRERRERVHRPSFLVGEPDMRATNEDARALRRHNDQRSLLLRRQGSNDGCRSSGKHGR